MCRLRSVLLVALAWLIVLSAGCSRGSTEQTIPADIASILREAAGAMEAIDTVRFTIERSGAVLFIDDEEILAFESAEGRFAAPSSADALVTVKALGLTTQVGAVAIDGMIYLSNPVTGRWEAAPADFTFDPATLFDPGTGWTPLLSSGLTDPELIGVEEADDGARYHIRGLGDADRVGVITGGLVTDAALLDLWIDAASGFVREAEFETTTTAGLTGWRLELFGYGDDVEITVPDLGGG